MKIYFLSDLRLDHYIFENQINAKMDRQIDNFLKISGISNIPEDERYAFIIPGDLSNFNNSSKRFLQRLKELFEYVLITNGNRDLYLTSNSQPENYKFIRKDVRFLCNPFGYPGETIYVVDWFKI